MDFLFSWLSAAGHGYARGLYFTDNRLFCNGTEWIKFEAKLLISNQIKTIRLLISGSQVRALVRSENVVWRRIAAQHAVSLQ
jgi:hypothetical protein